MCHEACCRDPLLKKTDLDPEKMTNYRPISNLSFVSKLLEKHVATQVRQHLKENGLFDVFQSAYRPAHSCETAALNISTGPLALRTFQTAGPVRVSTLYLSLAMQDHQVKCRASRLKITVARSMTNFATFSCIMFLKFRYVCIA